MSDGTDNQCLVNVVYKFKGQHTGNKCEYINTIDLTMESFLHVVGPIYAPVETWTTSKRIFCPGETLDFELLVGENLCNRAGTEVNFDAKINHLADASQSSVIAFPEKNVITLPPVPAPVANPVLTPVG